MKLIGLIMAGGKGKRMKTEEEKPIIPLNKKPLLIHVADTLKKLKKISKIKVATTPQTPKTTRLAKENSFDIIPTSGNGYHSDLKEAIKKIKDQTILVISADLPLIKKETLKKIVKKFEESNKPALSVFVDYETLNLDIKPEDKTKIDNRKVTPAGINIIEGEKIEEPQIEQENIIISTPGLAHNINKKRDLQKAKSLIKERN